MNKVKKRRRSLLALTIALVFFILIQAAVSVFIDLDKVYRYRLNYNLFLKDQRSIEVVIDEMAKTIKKEKMDNYIILLGNSVAWGTNESSEHSLGRYLSDQVVGEMDAVFNLSAPSMQAGDIYTQLLMLEEKGIKTDNLMIGLTYSAFVDRTNGPRAVFWLGDYLREADPQAFDDVLPQIVASHYKYKSGWKYTEEKLLDNVLGLFPIYKYGSVVEGYLEQRSAGTDLLGDPRPWHQKKYTDERLTSPDYLSFFNPQPFDMSEKNWGVYFMNRIIERWPDAKKLVFVAGGNGELSRKEIDNPGYQNNLRLMDDYFAGKDVLYMNLQDVISADYFTDHVHLTKEGNEELASLLWNSWTGEVTP